MKQNIDFIQCTFARAVCLVIMSEEFHQDKPLQSMRDVFALDLRGYWDIIKYTPPAIRKLLVSITNVIVWIGIIRTS